MAKKRKEKPRARLPLRIPDALKDRLEQTAKAAGISLTAEITRRLQASLDASLAGGPAELLAASILRGLNETTLEALAKMLVTRGETEDRDRLRQAITALEAVSDFPSLSPEMREHLRHEVRRLGGEPIEERPKLRETTD